MAGFFVSLGDMEIRGREALSEALIVSGIGVIAISESVPFKPMKDLGRYSGVAIAMGGVLIGLGEQTAKTGKRV